MTTARKSSKSKPAPINAELLTLVSRDSAPSSFAAEARAIGEVISEADSFEAKSEQPSDAPIVRAATPADSDAPATGGKWTPRNNRVTVIGNYAAVLARLAAQFEEGSKVHVALSTASIQVECARDEAKKLPLNWKPRNAPVPTSTGAFVEGSKVELRATAAKHYLDAAGDDESALRGELTIVKVSGRKLVVQTSAGWRLAVASAHCSPVGANKARAERAEALKARKEAQAAKARAKAESIGF